MDPIDRIIALRKQIFQIQYEHWTKTTLFSIRWWFMIISVILSLVIWYKIVDKKRLNEISLVGFITAVLVFLFNTTGVEMTLWAYKAQIFGLVRTWSLYELINITVVLMLLYQFFDEWKKYIIALLITAAAGSFIVQPLLVHFGIYKLIKWRNLYSFPIYIFFGLVVKIVTSKIMKIQKRAIEKNLEDDHLIKEDNLRYKPSKKNIVQNNIEAVSDFEYLTSDDGNLELVEFSVSDGYIIGTIKNNSSITYKYVEVQINLLDCNENQIEDIIDNANNLEGNKQWKFKARVINGNATKYKIMRILGHY